MTAFVAAQMLLLAACSATSGGGDPSAIGGSSAESTSGAASGDAGAGYFSCNHDSDCVAVRLLEDCCNNGWKVAVAQSEEQAYLTATECKPEPRHFCPDYMVIDSRVPACDTGAKSCAMIAIADGGEATSGTK